jgi:hypothetical protein
MQITRKVCNPIFKLFDRYMVGTTKLLESLTRHTHHFAPSTRGNVKRHLCSGSFIIIIEVEQLETFRRSKVGKTRIAKSISNEILTP